MNTVLMTTRACNRFSDTPNSLTVAYLANYRGMRSRWDNHSVQRVVHTPFNSQFFFAHDILCVTLGKIAQTFLTLLKTVIFYEFLNFDFVALRPSKRGMGLVT